MGARQGQALPVFVKGTHEAKGGRTHANDLEFQQ